MKRIRSLRTIATSVDFVFLTISDVRNFRNAVTHITQVEFLSEQKFGVGTRFRETRLMNGREQTVEIEIAELVHNDRVRMVSNAGGTIWDTMFSVSEDTSKVALEMTMQIKPYRLMSKLITPLIRGLVVKGVEADMDAVMAYCESTCE